jgi:hypothetical protein
MEWSLPTESERGAKRRASSMQELEAFYAGMMARMSEVLPHLEQSSARDIPVETERLLYLTLSLAEVAPAVELFAEPTVSYGYDVARFVPGPEP